MSFFMVVLSVVGRRIAYELYRFVPRTFFVIGTTLCVFGDSTGMSVLSIALLACAIAVSVYKQRLQDFACPSLMSRVHVHEAAHAVAAFFYPDISLGIIRCHENRAFVATKARHRRKHASPAEDISVSLAAPAMEAIVYGAPDPGCLMDLRDAWRLSSQLSPSLYGRWRTLCRIQREAHALVTERAGAIHALADALKKAGGSMSRRDVVRVLGPKKAFQRRNG